MTERASHRKLPIVFKAQRDGQTRFGPSHCYVANLFTAPVLNNVIPISQSMVDHGEGVKCGG